MCAVAVRSRGLRLTPSAKRSNEIDQRWRSMIAVHARSLTASARSLTASARSLMVRPRRSTTAGAGEANASHVTRVETRSEWLPDAIDSNSRTSSGRCFVLNRLRISSAEPEFSRLRTGVCEAMPVDASVPANPFAVVSKPGAGGMEASRVLAKRKTCPRRSRSSAGKERPVSESTANRELPTVNWVRQHRAPPFNRVQCRPRGPTKPAAVRTTMCGVSPGSAAVRYDDVATSSSSSSCSSALARLVSFFGTITSTTR